MITQLEKVCKSKPREQKHADADMGKFLLRFLNYYENHFASALDRAHYRDFPESTRAGLEAFWIPHLSGFEGSDNPQLREAISILSALESNNSVEALIAVAAENVDKSNRARWMATRALGMIGDKAAVPELIHLSYHYNQNTRIWAHISLFRITGQNFGYDWNAWVNWWNENHGDAAGRITSERRTWHLETDGEGRLSNAAAYTAEELRDTYFQQRSDDDMYVMIGLTSPVKN